MIYASPARFTTFNCNCHLRLSLSNAFIYNYRGGVGECRYCSTQTENIYRRFMWWYWFRPKNPKKRDRYIRRIFQCAVIKFREGPREAGVKHTSVWRKKKEPALILDSVNNTWECLCFLYLPGYLWRFRCPKSYFWGWYKNVALFSQKLSCFQINTFEIVVCSVSGLNLMIIVFITPERWL